MQTHESSAAVLPLLSPNKLEQTAGAETLQADSGDWPLGGTNGDAAQQGQDVRAARVASPAAAAVRRMLNRSGNSLFTAIEPLSEEEFFSGGANGISVAWTVGHLACVFDLFTSWIRGNRCLLPKEVHAVFNSLDVKAPGGPTKAELVRKSIYSKGEIMFLLRGAQIEALKLLEKCCEQSWLAPPPGPRPEDLHTVGDIWEHLAVHTYWHMGELCGTFPRFHGTYTLNMLPHYFFYLPAERTGE
jgi:DinB superfamily